MTRLTKTSLATITACIVAGSAVAFGGTAASAAGTGAGKNVCANVLSQQQLDAGKHAATTAVSPDVEAAVTKYKSTHQLFPKPTAAELAESEAHTALKERMFANGEIKARQVSCARASTQATGQITWMYQYGQVTNYFCGPAVVSMFSATVPGSSPYNLDQWTVANYMGTPSAGGTGAAAETNGLNYYVGMPDFGFNFYGMVWMSDPPTAAQKTDFSNRLATNVGVSSPIAGLAWEVPYGPHLTGHPVSQEIGHWIEIGGYNTGTSQVWYADPATTVWSSVPAYSWFDTNTMAIILGGYGYIW
ncbi:hypothetical protein [Catellatospora sp. TT07R-123]|uniref:hypothetical protein n=1 Tax=Catellatospora sp. TT07R-123 TaxID=2733863 RepID=UPI001BB3F497|nr:hypothetical protein [Catellatospora sp. TT07R-123]